VKRTSRTKAEGLDDLRVEYHRLAAQVKKAMPTKTSYFARGLRQGIARGLQKLSTQHGIAANANFQIESTSVEDRLHEE